MMYCYYYNPKVCAAAVGSLVGATIFGIGGIILGVEVAETILCATVILCLLALFLALFIVLASAIAGSFIVGNLFAAIPGSHLPTSSSGNTIKVGQLVTIIGNMTQRGEDNNANVMWFAHCTCSPGRISDDAQPPYSYCEIDDQFKNDACPGDFCQLVISKAVCWAQSGRLRR